LAPKLFKTENLERTHGIRERFLHHICILQKLGGYQNPLLDDLPLNRVNALSPTEVMVGLFHRQLDTFKTGRSRLITQRGTLEYRLAQTGFFENLAQTNTVFRKFLLDWGYISKESTSWERFKNFMGQRFGSLFGNVRSLRLFSFNLTQEKGALLFYPILILLFVGISYFVSKKWNENKEDRLQVFQMTSPGRTE